VRPVFGRPSRTFLLCPWHLFRLTLPHGVACDRRFYGRLGGFIS
jgi:hypothetical protein